MSAFIDLKGKTFFTLEVIEFASVEHTHAFWKVKCNVCGDTKNISGSQLIGGFGKGCNSCTKWKLPYKTRLAVAQAYDDGIKNNDIMEEFEVTRSSIYKIIKDFGIKANRTRRLT